MDESKHGYKAIVPSVSASVSACVSSGPFPVWRVCARERVRERESGGRDRDSERDRDREFVETING